jgi:signal transduction histidine kinase
MALRGDIVSSLRRSRPTRYASVAKQVGKAPRRPQRPERRELSARTLPAGRDDPGWPAGGAGDMALLLEQQIQQLVAERVDADHALFREIASRRRAEAALRRLNLALEDQARRVAADLHAEAAQFLAAAYLTLADIEPELSPELRERLRTVQRSLSSVEDRMRDVCHELRPRLLEDLGLVGGLRFLAERVTRRTGIAVRVEITVAGRLDPMVETAIYRVVQDALANVVKHSRATCAAVVFRQDDDAIRGVIEDNGCGFDVATVRSRPSSTLGLRVIQDRLEAVRGRLHIVSVPGTGSELRVVIPVDQDHAASSTPRR